MVSINQTVAILSRLVSFDTTSARSNLPLIEYVEDYLSQFDCSVTRVEGPASDKTNLFVTFGPRDKGGYILSGHSDTVPIFPWAASPSPLELFSRDGRLYGRGTADMKGFIAACLAFAPVMAEAPLQVPIHHAISFDEEVGCLGVRSLLDHLSRSRPKPLGCFVGEPTEMKAVIGHKGKRGFRTTVTSRAGHSSRAPEHVNAIETAAALIAHVKSEGARLQREGQRDDLYDIPHSTIATTMVEGGVATNVIPGKCAFAWEMRAIAANEKDGVPERIIEHGIKTLLPELRSIDPEAAIEFAETISYPALDTPSEHPLVGLAQSLSGVKGVSKVAFGTEGGLFTSMASVPAVIIGPGSIAQAHTVDEYIEVSQLETCGQFLGNLIKHCCQ